MDYGEIRRKTSDAVKRQGMTIYQSKIEAVYVVEGATSSIDREHVHESGGYQQVEPGYVTKTTTSVGSKTFEGPRKKRPNFFKKWKNHSKTRIRKTRSDVRVGRKILFCKIDSYQGTDSKKYFVSSTQEEDIIGDTGIRIGDELLTVNKHKLESQRLSDILKAFRGIRSGDDGSYVFQLVIRRWKARFIESNPKMYTTYEVLYKLKLTLVNDQVQRCDACVLINKTGPKNYLPVGNVIGITISSSCKRLVKCDRAKREEYLLAANAGTLTCGNLKTPGMQDVFDVVDFQGQEETPSAPLQIVFGKILSYQDPFGRRKYLESFIGHGQTNLQFIEGTDIDTTNPDERFFLIHDLGNWSLMESLVFRGTVYLATSGRAMGSRYQAQAYIGYCIHFDGEHFSMKHFTQDQIYEQSGSLDTFSGCLFDLIPLQKFSFSFKKVRGSTQLYANRPISYQQT